MSFSGERTILFGGSGFLGPHILRAAPRMVSVGRRPPRGLPNRHIPIQSLSDLSPLRDVEFDRVVYIIGNTNHKALEKPELTPGEPTAFDFHVTPLIQTLEQLKQREIRQFIHFSSILVYDETRLELPVGESAPLAPYKSRYALSKYLAEEAAKYYGRWMPIAALRLANLYGPSDIERWDIVHTISRELIARGAAKMWTVEPARDFIHVDDAAAAVLALLPTAGVSGPFNLGSGTMTSLGRIRELLEEASGARIEVSGQPVTGPMQFQCDIAALRRAALGWAPRVPVDEGIPATYRALKAIWGA